MSYVTRKRSGRGGNICSPFPDVYSVITSANTLCRKVELERFIRRVRCARVSLVMRGAPGHGWQNGDGLKMNASSVVVKVGRTPIVNGHRGTRGGREKSATGAQKLTDLSDQTVPSLKRARIISAEGSHNLMNQ